MKNILSPTLVKNRESVTTCFGGVLISFRIVIIVAAIAIAAIAPARTALLSAATVTVHLSALAVLTEVVESSGVTHD
jgi:hypothetical protein